MALTTYFKADNTTALNLAGSWTASPAGPPPSATTSQARWDSTVTIARSSALGATTTWGQIIVVNPGGACTIAATAGATLTLTPTDASAAGIGIDMSTATQSFTVASLTALGSSQSWSVASGRTLTVTGVVSGAFSLTKTGVGTLALSTSANTFGGAGQSFTASAGLTTVANIASLGNASNTVTIQSGAAVSFTAIPNQTTFAVAGIGSASQLAALHSTVAFAAGKIITVSGGDVTLSFGLSASFAAKITGSSTGDVILNFTNVATTASFNNASTDFTVGSGKYVRIRSVNVTTGAGTLGSYVPGASEAGLGNATNKVFVESTASVNSPAASTITLARDYKFEGEIASGTLASGKNWAVEVAGNASAIANFTGTIEGTAGYYVKVASSTSSPFGTAKFSGAFSGSWNLQGYATGSTAAALWLDSTLNVSSWTGNTAASILTYGISPGGAITYGSTTTTLDSSVADLVVSHTSYTRDGGSTVLFTGSNSLTLGPSGSSWSAAPGAWNITASTLSLAFSFNGTTGTLTKNGAGTLALSGNNTAVTAITWNTGNLSLNSAGSAGSTTATLTQTSTGTIDNTSGGDVSLTATGAWAWSANYTWGGGTGTLYRNSTVTYAANRTITFVSGKSGTLKIGGTIANASATLLNVGGGATGTGSRLWVVGANLSTATTAGTGLNTVTAGYYRIENANGLGAAASEIRWDVSPGGSLELYSGITTPSNKVVVLDGEGVNNDGALCSVQGNNTFLGLIAAATTNTIRIRCSANTFTIDGSINSYIANISNSPLKLDAANGATLILDRIIDSLFTNVTCGNNGSGRVELSRANLFTGTLLCSTGVTALKHVNAAGTASTGTTVSASAYLAVEVPTTYKATIPGTTTLGSSPSSKAYFRIGA